MSALARRLDRIEARIRPEHVPPKVEIKLQMPDGRLIPRSEATPEDRERSVAVRLRIKVFS